MRIVRTIEWSAWILGVALLGLYVAARAGSEHARAAAVAEFEAAHPQGAAASEAVPGELATDEQRYAIDRSLWSPGRAAAYVEAAAAPGTADAILRIPSLALEVPVYPSTSELDLNRGAGHIEGTAPPGPEGHVGIAGHRDGFFRMLERLALDAEMHLDTPAARLRYRVVDIRIVAPEDVHVLAPTVKPTLTLVTCYPFYFLGAAPERYIVRAELVAESPSASPERYASTESPVVSGPTQTRREP